MLEQSFSRKSVVGFNRNRDVIAEAASRIAAFVHGQDTANELTFFVSRYRFDLLSGMLSICQLSEVLAHCFSQR